MDLRPMRRWRMRYPRTTPCNIWATRGVRNWRGSVYAAPYNNYRQDGPGLLVRLTARRKIARKRTAIIRVGNPTGKPAAPLAAPALQRTSAR